MIKEDVVIEITEQNKVYVIPFDIINEIPINGVTDVCTRKLAYKKYNIVGEVYNGDTLLYKKRTAYEDDYSEFIDPELEED